MGSQNDLTLKVGFDIDKFTQELNKTNGTLNKWASNVKSSLLGVAAGFTAIGIANFALDISRLAGEAEGVKAAFDKLPNSTKLMMDLKQATAGTVSELDLMKRAVMASNFDISLEALPRLLEFASVRAKQTGQSVNYLVDSIVTGIGRKSKLILDNLGISAVQLTEALGGASTASSSIAEVADAVGKIAEQALGNMGRMSENNSTKLERLEASWENVKVAIGDTANGTGVLGGALKLLTDAMDVAASKNLSFWQKFAALSSGSLGITNAKLLDYLKTLENVTKEQDKQKRVTEEVDRALATFGNNLDAIKKAYQQHIYYKEILAELAKREIELAKKEGDSIENIANLEAKLTNLKEEQSISIGKNLALVNQEIKSIEAKIKALKELGTVEGDNIKRREIDTVRTKKSAFQKMQDAGPEKIKGNVVTPQVGSWALYEKLMAPVISVQKKIEEATDKANKKFLEQREIFEKNAQMAANFGMMIGDAIGDMINGQLTLVQVFARTSQQIVQSIGKVIMAKMIEKAIDDKATNFNFFAKLALIGVAIGAASSILGRIGAKSGGGGVGGGGGGGSYGGRAADNIQPQPVIIQVNGTWKAAGTELQLVLDKNTYNRGKIG